ncbi:hypothetical protein DER46DRAFT_651940 [Fusarium sp. MPI-SDFR-AT-0072]|nr:hypothetical protein DER46DRAFT_651940 [Fusarium sp. MPI-SDFR-AT-0072]
MSKQQVHLPRTGIEPVILSLLVIRFTTEPTGLAWELVGGAFSDWELEGEKRWSIVAIVFAFTMYSEYCIKFTLILESGFNPIKWANATTNSEPTQTIHLSIELDPNNNIR